MYKFNTPETTNKLYPKFTMNSDQYQALNDFMIHVYHVNFNKEESYFKMWSDKLDRLDIPWAVQNLAAYCMRNYNSKHYYSHTLLKNVNVLLPGVTA